jgi:diguanylate cyclase (GGDEF)-like protein
MHGAAAEGKGGLCRNPAGLYHPPMRAGSFGVILLCMAAAGMASAQAPSPRSTPPIFTTLGTSEGLPNASVSGVVQDSQGFLWFGTQGGLARYDGYSFKLFGHVPFDSGSLPHDQVQTLYLDGDLLWVGTYGGLARLDLRTERFVSYANDPARADSLSNDVVTCVVRDARGLLWVGTLAGLNLLDEATGRFTRFLHDAADSSSLPSDIVRALKADGQGRLWVGTSGGGLARFDYDARRFRSYKKDPAASGRVSGEASSSILSDYVMSMDLDPTGRMWVATWYGGLSLFDPETGRFENHPTEDERAYSICAAKDGTVYVGTWGGGLFAYDVASGAFERMRASASPGSLPNDVVYSLLRDSSGNLWVGTNGGGVSMLGAGSRDYEAISAGEGALPPGKIYSVLIDRLGYLWVGVYNQGIARRDPVTGAWRRYRREAGNPRSLPNDIVNFIREDSDGALWAGTNDGLARYDRASDSFSTVRPVAGLSDSMSSEIVYAMEEDPRGGAWIGTFRSGLEFWADRKGGPSGFAHYPHVADDPSSLSDNLVTALARDGEGRLWVGTNKGLNRLEGAHFVRYLYDPSKPGGVSGDSIRAIYLDSRKILWVGSAGGGLMRYEPETDSFVSYTRKDGLPSNTVVRVLEDESGNIWVATQAGLAVYARSSGRLRSLPLGKGMGGAEFFSGAFRALDGRLYFGALDRLYLIDPLRYSFNDNRPPVALASIEPKGRPAIPAAAAARLTRLDLAWSGNSVVFDFAALDYRDPAKNLYSYRLEGFDADWSEPGPNHSATYTNLPGGNFVFRVRASNNDGLWNEEGLSLPVRVGFKPWLSPWAMVLFAIAWAAAGYALAYYSQRPKLRAARGESDKLLARMVELSASMESAAIIDRLTGLPNRIKLTEHLELAFSRAVQMKLDLAVVMVDIDHFKAYNDRFGRAAGDDCLRAVAEALSSCVKRSSDIVGRYGGEEFLYVLEQTGLEGALLEGESARKAVEGLAISRDDSRAGPVVTVSVGCAAFQPEAGNSPGLLVEAAEKALMAAKQRGRNRTSD